ncbi:unnamed protein product, partial [Durusdinium trenchii]
MPLYLRLEGNYINEDAIKEKVSSGIIRPFNKTPTTSKTAPMDGPKANLVVKGSTFGQKQGDPPAPENAPPPKEVFDRNQQRPQQDWNPMMWMMGKGFWWGPKGMQKAGMQKGYMQKGGVFKGAMQKGMMALPAGKGPQGKGKDPATAKPSSQKRQPEQQQWQQQSAPEQQSWDKSKAQGWQGWEQKQEDWKQDLGSWKTDDETEDWKEQQDWTNAEKWQKGQQGASGNSWNGKDSWPQAQEWKRQEGRRWNSAQGNTSADRSRTPAPR